MFFSILIPTRDRPKLLNRCLESIGLLDFPRDAFEVIVIDDGSRPPVDDIVARHAAAIPVRLLQQGGHGPARARNLGLAEARGRYILFTDDDCRLHPGCLRAYQRAFEVDPTAAWGGHIQPDEANPIFGDASQLLVTYLYRYLDNRVPLVCSNNMAIPRQPLLELGGFDESFPLAAAEDRDLCDRWVQRHPLRHAPEAIVIHYQRLSFLGFLRQQFRYGRGSFQFNKRREQRGSQSLGPAPLSFYSRMLLFPWRASKVPVAALHTVLIALSQAANLAGFVYEWAR